MGLDIRPLAKIRAYEAARVARGGSVILRNTLRFPLAYRTPDRHLPENVDARGGYYETPLLAAVTGRKEDVNDLDVVRLLIDSSADVNSHDNEGWTPLHSASRQGGCQYRRIAHSTWRRCLQTK